MTETVKQLKELCDHSQRIVFFGGAGVSTESEARMVCIIRSGNILPKSF